MFVPALWEMMVRVDRNVKHSHECGPRLLVGVRRGPAYRGSDSNVAVFKFQKTLILARAGV